MHLSQLVGLHWHATGCHPASTVQIRSHSWIVASHRKVSLRENCAPPAHPSPWQLRIFLSFLCFYFSTVLDDWDHTVSKLCRPGLFTWEEVLKYPPCLSVGCQLIPLWQILLHILSFLWFIYPSTYRSAPCLLPGLAVINKIAIHTYVLCLVWTWVFTSLFKYEDWHCWIFMVSCKNLPTVFQSSYCFAPHQLRQASLWCHHCPGFCSLEQVSSFPVSVCRNVD